MKNVTLSIDDHVLARARKLAAERGTSVNQMVRDYLARETSTETQDAYLARMEMAEMARRGGPPRTLLPWTREELYDRGVSGYERDRLRGLGTDGGPGEAGEGGGDHAG
jgi:NifB/MoaA-like Fe-S oxidoreductase